MLTVTQAQQTVLESIGVLGKERVLITSAIHRVLAEDIVANLNHPPWDNSAMDGYAVCAQDLLGASRSTPVRLRIVEEIQAGRMASQVVRPGTAASIMTGAPIPSGADAVVEVEQTQENGKGVLIYKEVSAGRNIRRMGENVRIGEEVLARGRRLGAPEIAMLALLGRSVIPVYRQPLVAIIATGDELADLDEGVREGQIYNSNGYALWAQAVEAGALPRVLGIVRDDKAQFTDKLREALDSDLVLLSGAVSVGKYDYAPGVMERLGVKIRFRTVAMRPGHPLLFGMHGNTPVLGLPGNPVSTMIAFHEFVRPALLKMIGRSDPYLPVVQAVLMENFKNHSGRTHFVRVRVEYADGGYRAWPVGPQGSGVLMSMVHAGGLMVLPRACEKVNAGETVCLQLLGESMMGRADPGFTEA